MHPPKAEEFDVGRGINVDPKGIDRPVDAYRTTPFGLYMARGANHPRFGYLESWLLPELGLRVNKFHERAGGDFYGDFYCDIATIAAPDDPAGSGDTPATWTTRDLYLDLILREGQPVDIDDIDELAQAAADGLVTAAEAEFAVEAALRAVAGITRHGDSLPAWLSAIGLNLDWAESVTLTPVDAP